MPDRLTKFRKGVHCKLKSYVYRLIDPRDEQTFYVGKGQRDRVFNHLQGVLNAADEEESTLPLRLKTIKEILDSGLEPIHIIHRHGMDENEAEVVEAALIDYIPGLTNKISGRGSDFGPANAVELNDLYGREEMIPSPEHKLLFVKTHWKTVEDRGGCIYEAARWSWGVKVERARRTDFVLAIIDGVCEAIFTNCVWKRHDNGEKYEFKGDPILEDDEVSQRYLKKLAPARVRRQQKEFGYIDGN